MCYPDDDPGYEAEAIENERAEADFEQAEMNRAGNAVARAERRGICTHGSTVGYSGGPRRPEQAGLEPGQSRCTKGTGGCARVFESDDEWYAAMDEAVGR